MQSCSVIMYIVRQQGIFLSQRIHFLLQYILFLHECVHYMLQYTHFFCTNVFPTDSFFFVTMHLFHITIHSLSATMHSLYVRIHLCSVARPLYGNAFLFYKPLMTRRAINSEIHLHTPTSRQCSKRCLLV